MRIVARTGDTRRGVELEPSENHRLLRTVGSRVWSVALELGPKADAEDPGLLLMEFEQLTRPARRSAGRGGTSRAMLVIEVSGGSRP